MLGWVSIFFLLATFAVTGSAQSIKVAFANGLTTRFGGDVTTIAVGWQYAWVE